MFRGSGNASVASFQPDAMARGENEQLFARFVEHGDLDALARVFDRTAPRLLAVARHLARDEASAEDLVQATFLVAIERARRFDADRELEAWLIGILTNHARDQRKAQRKEIDPSRLDFRAVASPDESARMQEFVDGLQQALERVPASYRDLLRVHLVEGRSADEIARASGEPSSTVRVRLMRGLQHLRRVLPAGFALGAAAVVAPRGLAAVRASVLANASTHIAAGATSTVVMLGGLVVKKKALVAAIVIALASLIGVAAWNASRGENEPSAAVVDRTTLEALPAVEAPSTPVEQASVASENRVVVASSDPYGALDVVVRWHDGTPAVEQWVGVRCEDELRPQQTRIEGRTDAHGRFHAERAHEGEVVAGLAFSAAIGRGRVVRGTTTVIEMDVLDEPDVHGLVVDRARRPVTGADVYVGDLRQERGGVVLAHTGSDGSFLVRAVDPRKDVMAIARGHAPSEPASVASLPRSNDGTREVVLILEDGGATLNVTVLRADGTPAHDEWIEALVPGMHRNDGRPGLWVMTDASGATTFEGLPATSIELLLSPNDAPCTRRTVELAANANASVTIELARGAFVSGTITKADGTPWAGTASVMAELAGRLPNGSLDRAVSSACFRYARTDANGRYRLGPLPAGEIALSADGMDPARKERLARDRRTLVLVEGAEATWDVLLDAPRAIRGRIVDAAGQPGVGWVVSAVPEGASIGSKGVLTDAKGRFVVSPCAAGPHVVHVNGPTGRGLNGATVEHVMPDAAEIEVRVEAVGTESERPTPFAWVIGRILDSHGGPASVWVSLRSAKDPATPGAHTNDDGTFQIELRKAGTYSLVVIGMEEQHTLVDALEVGQTGRVDVGTLALPACGTFVLHVTRSDGSKVEGPYVELVDERGTSRMIDRASDGAFRSKRIAIGKYVLRAQINVRLPETPVEIRADERTELELVGDPGVNVLVGLVVPKGELIPESVRLELRQGSDPARTFDVKAAPESTRSSVLLLAVPAALKPGPCTWSATSSDGWSGGGTFEVAADHPQVTLRLEKR